MTAETFKRYRCRVCGYETCNPRKDARYVSALRCEDVCCDGPVVEIPPVAKEGKQ